MARRNRRLFFFPYRHPETGYQTDPVVPGSRGLAIVRWLEERQSVLEAARRIRERGLVLGTAGNVSRRLAAEDGRQLLAITPSARDYDLLAPEDIPIVDFEGRAVEGKLKPSVEVPLHVAIYRARPDVNAIVHTHSVFATALAVAGIEIPPLLEEQIVFLGGGVRLAPYAPSGSAALASNATAALGECNAVLLANHGAVGVGKTMAEAFHAAELLERVAQVFLLAMSTGRTVKSIGPGVEFPQA